MKLTFYKKAAHMHFCTQSNTNIHTRTNTHTQTHSRLQLMQTVKTCKLHKFSKKDV
uniref:Uncharacterized protein n=1 Tax=Arion vulgaris TaxID=1028688 RepID=A0A0B6Z697_9EUPU